MSDQNTNSNISEGAQSATPLTAEAQRLCAVFQAAAERELSAMTASARLVLRAWAEAELAVLAARRSGEPGGQDLPSAEAFRIRPYLAREEASREEIIRWCGYRNQPIDDAADQRAVWHNGAWVVMHPGTSIPSMVLGERALYQRITYLEAQNRIDAPPLAASLAVPALLAGGNVGWEPIEHFDPADIVARLDKLEAGYVDYPAERKCTVEDVLQRYVPRPQRPTPPVTGTA